MWAVRPAGLLDERRRVADRRAPASARAAHPPALERRRGTDRRQPGSRRDTTRRSSVLPAAWRDGWLLFEAGSEPRGASTAGARRLAPIPDGWDVCDQAALVAHLHAAAAATERRAG